MLQLSMLRRMAVAISVVATGVMLAPAVAHAGGQKKPSFDDPRGLCKAIPSLPAYGWNDAARTSCNSFTRAGAKYAAPMMVERVAARGPCTYAVLRMYGPTTVRLSCFSRGRPDLSKLAAYARALSDNSALHLTDAMLADIRHGKPFTATVAGLKMEFNVRGSEADLLISQAGTK